MAAVAIMYVMAGRSIREHNDAWLIGEVEVLRQVSITAPPGASYAGVIRAIAASAAEEVTGASRIATERNEMIFFLLTDATGGVVVWLGPGDAPAFLRAIGAARVPIGVPRTLAISGEQTPFRIVRDSGANGTQIYLGLSDVHAVRLMKTLLARLAMIWIGAVMMAWALLFISTRRLLARVESITEATRRIQSDDLRSRIPEGEHADEIARLARTLNGMLDRVAQSVNELRSLTDTVAHELKTPLTSIRGRLETVLACEDVERGREAASMAIDDLDRLSAFITTTLDVAEGEGGGLRLCRSAANLSDLLRQLLELYEPALAERQQRLHQAIAENVVIHIDPLLMGRAISNLLENELRHPGPGASVSVVLTADENKVLLRLEDDGAGFPAEVETRMFARFVKGVSSGGHGLGLTFARAIVVAHGGLIAAGNRSEGGAFVNITLPRRDQRVLIPS